MSMSKGNSVESMGSEQPIDSGTTAHFKTPF